MTGAALAFTAAVLLLLIPTDTIKVPMREILVTNDDGVHSEGIHELAAALAHLGEVTIVAPIRRRARSAMR